MRRQSSFIIRSWGTSSLFIQLITILILFCPVVLYASVDIPIGDWRYEAIERIVLSKAIAYPLNTLPITEQEVQRFISGSESFTLLQESNAKNRMWIDIESGVANSNLILPNNYNLKYSKGENLVGKIRLSGKFLLDYDLALLGNINSKEFQNKLQWGYFRLPLKWADVTIGRRSHWWGPGQHGSWLLTNNAESFDQINISSRKAFKYIKRSRFDIIIGRLSKQNITYIYQGTRTTRYAQPGFIGLRFACSPNRYLELGAGGTYMFAARNGNLSIKDYWQTLFPNKQSTTEETDDGPITNRIGAIDVTIKVPVSSSYLKGLKFYWEYGGEDGANSIFGLPWLSGPANLFGLYLDNGYTNLRIEYAESQDDKLVWYTHGQWTEGYRHQGAVIGHQIEGGAKDWWMKISHSFVNKWVSSIELETRDGISKRDVVELQLNRFKDPTNWGIRFRYTKEDNLNYAILLIGYEKRFDSIIKKGLI